MTFVARNVLKHYGDEIQDAATKQGFKDVLNRFRFSSTKPDAVAYEGEFDRALEDAGIGSVIPDLKIRYMGIFQSLDQSKID